MAVRTSSSSRDNPAAQLSVVLGAVALAAIPAAVAAAQWLPVRLLEGLYVAVPSALVLGLLAVAASRRARRSFVLSLGRAGSERRVRAGRALAYGGLYVATMGVLALVSYAVLRLYGTS